MSRDTPETLDLDVLAAWCRTAPRGAWIGPNDLMRSPSWRLTRNAACGALEALEARGVLDRIPGSSLAWKLATSSFYASSEGKKHEAAPLRPDGRRLSIILSDKEHAALLVGLDILAEIGQVELRLTPDRLATLRSLRSRLLRKETP